MMNVRRIAACLALGLALCGVGPSASARSREAKLQLEAVEPPRSLMAGRVYLKDGVTAVPRVELSLTSSLDGSVRKARAGRRGRFEVSLPIGQYSLRISRGLEVFESPSVYHVSGGHRMQIDFLLVPDFEKSDDQRPLIATRAGPDPRAAAPVVVGSVVDMVHSTAPRRQRRWLEALGFLGSVLAIAIAAQ
jgi:hypothetical protein